VGDEREGRSAGQTGEEVPVPSERGGVGTDRGHRFEEHVERDRKEEERSTTPVERAPGHPDGQQERCDDGPGWPSIDAFSSRTVSTVVGRCRAAEREADQRDHRQRDPDVLQCVVVTEPECRPVGVTRCHRQ